MSSSSKSENDPDESYTRPRRAKTKMKCVVEDCPTIGCPPNSTHCLTRERYIPWMKAIKQSPENVKTPNYDSYICQKHFALSQRVGPNLKPNAIPTLNLPTSSNSKVCTKEEIEQEFFLVKAIITVEKNVPADEVPFMNHYYSKLILFNDLIPTKKELAWRLNLLGVKYKEDEEVEVKDSVVDVFSKQSEPVFIQTPTYLETTLIEEVDDEFVEDVPSFISPSNLLELMKEEEVKPSPNENRMENYDDNPDDPDEVEDDRDPDYECSNDEDDDDDYQDDDDDEDFIPPGGKKSKRPTKLYTPPKNAVWKPSIKTETKVIKQEPNSSSSKVVVKMEQVVENKSQINGSTKEEPSSKNEQIEEKIDSQVKNIITKIDSVVRKMGKSPTLSHYCDQVKRLSQASISKSMLKRYLTELNVIFVDDEEPESEIYFVTADGNTSVTDLLILSEVRNIENRLKYIGKIPELKYFCEELNKQFQGKTDASFTEEAVLAWLNELNIQCQENLSKYPSLSYFQGELESKGYPCPEANIAYMLKQKKIKFKEIGDLELPTKFVHNKDRIERALYEINSHFYRTMVQYNEDLKYMELRHVNPKKDVTKAIAASEYYFYSVKQVASDSDYYKRLVSKFGDSLCTINVMTQWLNQLGIGQRNQRCFKDIPNLDYFCEKLFKKNSVRYSKHIVRKWLIESAIVFEYEDLDPLENQDNDQANFAGLTDYLKKLNADYYKIDGEIIQIIRNIERGDGRVKLTPPFSKLYEALCKARSDLSVDTVEVWLKRLMVKYVPDHPNLTTLNKTLHYPCLIPPLDYFYEKLVERLGTAFPKKTLAKWLDHLTILYYPSDLNDDPNVQDIALNADIVRILLELESEHESFSDVSIGDILRSVQINFAEYKKVPTLDYIYKHVQSSKIFCTKKSQFSDCKDILKNWLKILRIVYTDLDDRTKTLSSLATPSTTVNNAAIVKTPSTIVNTSPIVKIPSTVINPSTIVQTIPNKESTSTVIIKTEPNQVNTSNIISPTTKLIKLTDCPKVNIDQSKDIKIIKVADLPVVQIEDKVNQTETVSVIQHEKLGNQTLNTNGTNSPILDSLQLMPAKKVDSARSSPQLIPTTKVDSPRSSPQISVVDIRSLSPAVTPPTDKEMLDKPSNENVLLKKSIQNKKTVKTMMIFPREVKVLLREGFFKNIVTDFQSRREVPTLDHFYTKLKEKCYYFSKAYLQKLLENLNISFSDPENGSESKSNETESNGSQTLQPADKNSDESKKKSSVLNRIEKKKINEKSPKVTAKKTTTTKRKPGRPPKKAAPSSSDTVEIVSVSVPVIEIDDSDDDEDSVPKKKSKVASDVIEIKEDEVVEVTEPAAEETGTSEDSDQKKLVELFSEVQYEFFKNSDVPRCIDIYKRVIEHFGDKYTLPEVKDMLTKYSIDVKQ
ncbi:uncharacterized protein LOC114324529 [Diabrotica virgifera virgifera]|uniref:THAP-type domain-containing protein n=1 Tax=Diabrotica virgifera virgifera TaxID=50390 RepID=A0ABM5I9U5_DIAVI|nr:uncharacterized protein LOC114324529 [Diabrotica virgifera virgifera]